MRKTMGAAMPGKKSTRFRIVLTLRDILIIDKDTKNIM